jgi:hypothetical protein
MQKTKDKRQKIKESHNQNIKKIKNQKSKIKNKKIKKTL